MFRFPWSNFHELNLDWILEVVKETKEIFVNGRSDIDNAVETANEALEVAEQAAAAVIADGSITIPKLNNEVLKTTAYVIVGNRADDPVPAGAYVYLRKSQVAGLSDGIYIAATNIPAGAIVTPTEFQQPTELGEAGALNVLKNTVNQLKSDTFGSINLTGTNNTGSTITAGTFFYNNGSLVRAAMDIQNGSAITIGTNAETVTAGGLNDLKRLFGIAESGNNVNGSYIRFGNGTQICYGSFSVTIPANNYTEYVLTYPIAFNPGVAPICGFQQWADPFKYSVMARGSGQGSVTIRAATSESVEVSPTIWWFAVGRWM